MTTGTLEADRVLQKKLCEIVTSKTGIQLPENKRTMIEGRLRKRVRALGVRDLRTYLSMVMNDGMLDTELPHIINVMTTNKTDFFREDAHFDYLVRNVLPEHAAGRPFKVWSAASSSGEEAYTTAMVLTEHAKRKPGFTYSIIGTDLSTEVVRKARKGIYTPEEIVDVPDDMQALYMEQGHDSVGRPLSRVVKQLRDRVGFAQMNLMDKAYPVEKNLDVVFLRNVLIYFDEATQHQVVSSVTNHLKPGGYLFVGHSETSVASDPRLVQKSAAVFRKEA
ncbi:CheR family methyltransferase [Thalassovita sp.]|uniref:CheR family methyltransferase n=1 Tax=Thalassovita sp. TaxID=1979401 RepID=UPI002AB15162|nr:CheR family methyltransferase [Thalassovita sp.]